MLGTTLPTPLYPAYERQFGFADLMTTVIYAVYAAGVLAALVLLGRASDAVGRRPMLLTGLGLSAASAAVFLADTGLAVLFLGRVLSGLSAGIFTGTATVALVELVAPPRRGTASLLASGVNMLGLGCGPLLAGLLAQWAPWPTRLPYAADLLLLLAALVVVLLSPETVQDPGGGRFRPQRPGVPAQARAAFVPAAVVAFAAFAVFGLLTAIEPAFLGSLLHLPSPALAGAVVFSMFAGSTVGQVVLARNTGPTTLPTGCVVLVAGLAGIAVALGTDLLTLLVIGTVIVGVGQGVSFRAGIAAVTAASPEDRRAETVSSFFVVAYVGISIPVILVGLAATAWGLRAAGIAFTIAVAALTVGALVAVLRLSRRDA
jgi:MFS family permease